LIASSIRATRFKSSLGEHLGQFFSCDTQWRKWATQLLARSRTVAFLRFNAAEARTSATGRFLLQQMVAVAELEAGMISARSKAALAAAKDRGKKLGGRRRKIIGVDDTGAKVYGDVANGSPKARATGIRIL
jgi:DNA invertase Pin-like site-specific DNA recombinase